MQATCSPPPSAPGAGEQAEAALSQVPLSLPHRRTPLPVGQANGREVEASRGRPRLSLPKVARPNTSGSFSELLGSLRDSSHCIFFILLENERWKAWNHSSKKPRLTRSSGVPLRCSVHTLACGNGVQLRGSRGARVLRFIRSVYLPNDKSLEVTSISLKESCKMEGFLVGSRAEKTSMLVQKIAQDARSETVFNRMENPFGQGECCPDSVPELDHFRHLQRGDRGPRPPGQRAR